MTESFDQAHQSLAPGIGSGCKEHLNTRDLQCHGCGKSFKREPELLRHWRVPIPCQISGCTQTFRDDKLKSYISHHATKHTIGGRQEIHQGQIKEYFDAKKGEYRNNIRPDLCTLRNPKVATPYQDGSANWHLNLPQGNSSLLGPGHGDKIAGRVLEDTHHPHATKLSLSGKLSGLRQELSHTCQFIDYLKTLVLKTESEKDDLERKIKVVEGVIYSSRSEAQPPLDHESWTNLVAFE